MKHFLAAFILVKLMSGGPEIRCEDWKPTNCGLNLYDCRDGTLGTKMYLCVHDVQVISQEDIRPVRILPHAKDTGR
jgi:hypothetical protein